MMKNFQEQGTPQNVEFIERKRERTGNQIYNDFS